MNEAIEELKRLLVDAENNRKNCDPNNDNLQWHGYIEGIKSAIYRLNMHKPVL
jgi:hypothetical protein